MYITLGLLVICFATVVYAIYEVYKIKDKATLMYTLIGSMAVLLLAMGQIYMKFGRNKSF